MSSTTIGVVILAAGASLRMGRPKLLLPWRDTTIAGQLYEQWRQLGSRQITFVCRPNDKLLSQELDELGVPEWNRIINPEPEHGMFSSIVCAAKWDGWMPDLTAWAIVLGDQPHLRDETLEELLTSHRVQPDAICQPECDGHRKHPVVLPASAFAALKDSKAATLKEFLASRPEKLFVTRTNDHRLSLDLDRPEDYERAITLYQT